MAFKDSKYAKLNEMRTDLRRKEEFKKTDKYRKKILLSRVSSDMERWSKM